jgi:hypothetical protein
MEIVDDRHTGVNAGGDALNLQDLFQDTLIYRGWGLPVIPVRQNKRPVLRWKPLQRRRLSDRELSRLFDRRHREIKGVAAVLGWTLADPAGKGTLAVRDFDTAGGFDRWAADHPDLAAELPTVYTGRGVHVYARLTDWSGYETFGDGDPHGPGELIADRHHYALLPPSLHPSGRRYSWRWPGPVRLADFPVLPLAATGFLSVPSRPSRRPHRRNSRDSAVTHRSTRSSQPTEHEYHLCATPGTAGAVEGGRPLAVLESLPLVVKEAVKRTLPRGEGERHAKLMYLARSLADVEAGTDPQRWEAVVRLWWVLAYKVIGTKAWRATWADFRDAWARLTIPVSQSRPVRVMTAAAEAEADPVAKLLAACRAKQADNGGKPFHLSCRVAAKLAGIPYRTAARMFLRLTRPGGPLVVHAKGRPSGLRRVATYYALNPLAEGG